jgi:hypothetical protein
VVLTSDAVRDGPRSKDSSLISKILQVTVKASHCVLKAQTFLYELREKPNDVEGSLPCHPRARRRGRAPVLHTWQTAYEIVR